MAILTRNAIHGGVETMIAFQRGALNADVIVAGGVNYPDTCPFPYVRADRPSELRRLLKRYDVVLYHWPPHWAVETVSQAGIPCAEFVHRRDTSDCDKSVPQVLVSHSRFVVDPLVERSGLRSYVLPHPIDFDLFQPAPLGTFVGGPTSYYATKGLDLLLEAWERIGNEFPDRSLRFYGQGAELDGIRAVARRHQVDAEFLPAHPRSHLVYPEFGCIVIPSRIEGLPFVALEALAMNLPVVASALPGMVELNDLAVARGFPPPLILFRTEDAEDLALVLRGVLSRADRPATREYLRIYYSGETHAQGLREALAEASLLAVQRRLSPDVGRWQESGV